MPYFIYRITEQPIRILKTLEQHETYRDASARVKQLRAELAENSPAIIKMIHAETELHAEDLLNQVREAGPELGDD
jgi:Fe2+ or Zn2+ uptake regulation protein